MDWRCTGLHLTIIGCWSKAPAVPGPGAAGLPHRGSPSLAKWFRVEKAATKFSRDAALAQVKVAWEAGEPENVLLLQILILNLLAPVDRSLPTTGQVELLQAKGGPWLAGHTRSLPLHFGHRTCDDQKWSRFHLWIYLRMSTHFEVLWHWHCLEDPSVFYGTLLPVA